MEMDLDIARIIAENALNTQQGSPINISRETLTKLLEAATRYEFLRQEDAWGEDTVNHHDGGEHVVSSAWDFLGELSGSDFDRFVDLKRAGPDNVLTAIKG